MLRFTNTQIKMALLLEYHYWVMVESGKLSQMLEKNEYNAISTEKACLALGWSWIYHIEEKSP